jgi:hypothetical protein
MTAENLFSSSKQALVIKPKTTPQAAFNYRGFADLKNLISFVGSSPKIDISKSSEPVLTFKKHSLIDGCIVMRDSFGNVTKVMSYAEANELYEIAAQRDFEVKDSNKVVTVSKPEPKK